MQGSTLEGALRGHEHDADWRHGGCVGGGLDAHQHSAGRRLNEALKRNETGTYVGKRTDADLGGAVECGGTGQELNAGAQDGLERVEPDMGVKSIQESS